MKKLIPFLVILLSLICLPLASAGTSGPKVYALRGGLSKGQRGLTNSQVDGGLKEALLIGVKTAVSKASRLNGFYRNPLIFIPFPPEARSMKSTLETFGFKRPVQKFVKTLNRAAEEASKRAAPIFIQAIKGLTIRDGFQILRGRDAAATRYLRRKTSRRLAREFRPIVRQAIRKVHVTKYWKPLVTRYNQVPFVKRVNPNLESYVTNKAVSGLFKLMAIEEKKIRKNPAARITNLLRRVFGS